MQMEYNIIFTDDKYLIIGVSTNGDLSILKINNIEVYQSNSTEILLVYNEKKSLLFYDNINKKFIILQDDNLELN